MSRFTALGVAGLVLALLLLRVPTLFEPPWAADEGFYADVGRSLDLGAVLYRDVWDNKPPGMYWLAAVINVGGASVFRMHLALFVIAALGAALTWMLGMRVGLGRLALLGAFTYVLLSSVSVFAGDQLNAEIVAAVPVTAGMTLVVAAQRVRTLLLPFLAGIAVALGCLMKTQVLADLLAVCAVPALMSIASEPRARAWWKDLIAVLGGWLTGIAAAAVPLLLTRTVHDLLALLGANSTYFSHFQAGPTLAAVTLGGQVMGVARPLLAVAAGAVVALVMARRKHATAALLVFWLACDLAAVMADARGLDHYVQQLVVPLSLTAALVVKSSPPAPVSRVAAGAACVAAAWLVAVGALYVPRLTGALASGKHAPGVPSPGVNSTIRYYANGWRHVFGAMSQPAYERSFDNGQYPLNVAMAQLIDEHSRPGDYVCVWALPDPWTFSLANRRSCMRFMWLDSYAQIYPGITGITADDVRRHPPAILISNDSLPAEVIAVLRSMGYTEVVAWRPSVNYWLAPSD